MKLEDQVCNLELANRLKELGVKQESLFYWMDIRHENNFTLHEESTAKGIDWKHNQIANLKFPDTPPEMYSAFTVAELGEMIIGISKKSLPSWDNAWGWVWNYWNPDNPGCEELEANARAKLMIYLTEFDRV